MQEADGVPATDEKGGADDAVEEGCQLLEGSPRGTKDAAGVGGAIGPVL